MVIPSEKMASIIQSQRGAEKLLLNGYEYYKCKKTVDKMYWRCAMTKRCSAVATTSHTGNNIKVLNESHHSHSPIEEDRDDVDQEDGTDEGSAEEESESSSSDDDETSVEESDEERWEWLPWQVEEDTSENEEDDVDGYTLLRHKIAYYKSILRTLRESTPSLRESVFTSADKGLICLFSEICWNVLQGKVSFTKQDKNLLSIFRDQINMFSSENISCQEKKDFLIQNPHDGFIPVLLTVLKPFIGTP